MSKNLPESQCAQEKSPPEELLAFDLSFFALGILTSFEGYGQLDTPLLQDGLRDGVGLIPGSSLRRYRHDTRLTRLQGFFPPDFFFVFVRMRRIILPPPFYISE